MQVATDIRKLDNMDEKIRGEVRLEGSQIHELSQRIIGDMPVYPGEPRPEFKPYFTIGKDKVNVSQLILGSHTGTHVDAPKHFFSNGEGVDKIAPETFIGEAVILEMSYKEIGHGITDADLNSYSKSVKARDIILLYTGTNDRLQGQDNTRKNFSYLEASAASWIVNHKVKCLGIDSFSVEKYGFAEGTVHKTLLAKNIGIIEGLDKALKNFVGKRMFLVCLPLLFKGLDGSPARAILFDIM